MGRLLSTCCMLAAVAGCRAKSPEAAPPEAPVIPISHPESRPDVTDYVDFTGRTSAIESVNIIPRVTGYLVKLPFKEGSEVKTGDLLFEVDPRPYKAQLDQAEGQVKLYQAQLKLAQATLARDEEVAKTPGAVRPAATRSGSGRRRRSRRPGQGVPGQHRGLQAESRLHQGHLADRRPGQPPVSHPGQPGQPGPDAPDHGRVAGPDVRLLRHGRADAAADPQGGQRRDGSNCQDQGTLPVSLGLQGEDGFPHKGTINFVNNQVNPATGSIAVRGVFDNPKPASGVRLLTPGMFVRVRLPIGVPHPALLVIDRAIASDQGLKFVYIVDEAGTIQQRRITTGAIQPDGLRVISDGLKPDDWVVVGGIQQVRPRMTVQTEKVDMPSFAQPAAEDSGKPEKQPSGGEKEPATTKQDAKKTRSG